MEIKRPMELAGLTSRLKRARATDRAIADTGKRYDKVLDQIDDLHGVSKAHVGQLETYAGELKSTIQGMIGSSNGGPNDDGQDGQTSEATVETAKVVAAVTPPAVLLDPPAESEAAPPSTTGTLPEFKTSG
jgi:hypothetical protein